LQTQRASCRRRGCMPFVYCLCDQQPRASLSPRTCSDLAHPEAAGWPGRPGGLLRNTPRVAEHIRMPWHGERPEGRYWPPARIRRAKEPAAAASLLGFLEGGPISILAPPTLDPPSLDPPSWVPLSPDPLRDTKARLGDSHAPWGRSNMAETPIRARQKRGSLRFRATRPVRASKPCFRILISSWPPGRGIVQAAVWRRRDAAPGLRGSCSQVLRRTIADPAPASPATPVRLVVGVGPARSAVASFYCG